MKQPIIAEWNGSSLSITSFRTIFSDILSGCPRPTIKGNSSRKTKPMLSLKRFLTACVILLGVSGLMLVAVVRSSFSAGDFASARGSNEPFRRGCLNANWEPRSTRSVWTMLTDGPSYVTSVLKLGVSIQKHMTPGFDVDLIVMELSTKPLSEETWERLKGVGWQQCTVDRIAPPPHIPGKTKMRFRDQFTKLHLWGMTGYETVLYLDADTLVVGNLQELLSTQLKSDKNIGAVLDFDNTDLDWTDTFNMGVFLLNPVQEEFERLLALREARDTIKTDLYLAEQAWLNQVYKDAWQDIGFIHNAQDAIYKGNRTLWDENRDKIRVIHYNRYKPWDWWPYNCGRIYGPLCEIWRKAPIERTESLNRYLARDT